MDRIRIPIDEDSYRGKFPYFPKPEAIGEFTVDRNRKMKLGRVDAKYLYKDWIKQSGVDLNKGYDQFEQKDGEAHIDMLLEWLMEMDTVNSQNPGQSSKKAWHEADIVCWRGLLTKITCTPYCTKDTWRFAAIRVHNVIYLCEEKTAEAIQREQTMTERDKIMTYWGIFITEKRQLIGHKFETYVASSDPEKCPVDSNVCCKEEFGVISKTRLFPRNQPPIRLVYGAEIDAITSDGDYVEVKTQRMALQGGFWKQKSLKWWVQSFLVGIEKLIVGFRDDTGIIRNLEQVRIDSLPRKGQWDCAVCLNFLTTVLAAVRGLLDEDLKKCKVSFNLQEVVIEALPENAKEHFFSSKFVHQYALFEL